ncbi:MAG TPA: hypothetical protein VHN13_20685 [Candidatus Tectomicrobia bacterium]|nr:hypothetical protein [Candidatus Tectomicrobia bacterium]
MSTPDTPAERQEATCPEAAAGTRLHGPWLVISRVVWAAVAVLAVGLVVAALPAQVLHLGRITDLERQFQMEMPPAIELALDVTSLLASLVVILGCLLLSGVIFWRRPADWMTLFVSLFLIAFGITPTGVLMMHGAPSTEWVRLVVAERVLLVVLMTVFPRR